jgi:hypothetical protein
MVRSGVSHVFQISLGDGVPRRWRGTIAVEQGRVIGFLPLTLETDQVCTHRLENGVLRFEQRNHVSYDGLQIRVEGNTDARLQIQLTPIDKGAVPETIEIALSDLQAEATRLDLDDHGNRLIICRAPNHSLQITIPRRHMIFEPGETLPLEATPLHLPLGIGDQAELILELHSPRSDDIFWTEQHAFTITRSQQAIRTAVPLPQVEGVYELIASVVSKSQGVSATGSWSNRETLARRRIQCVVLAREPLEHPSETWESLHEIETIDPTNPDHWTDRWERWLTLPRNLPTLPEEFPDMSSGLSDIAEQINDIPSDVHRFGQSVVALPVHALPYLRDNLSPGRLSESVSDSVTAIGESLAQLPEDVASLPDRLRPPSPHFGSGHLRRRPGLLEGFVELPGSFEAGRAAWQAYTIPIDSPGRPYVVEIVYPESPQTLGIAVIEPNASGFVAPPFQNFGFHVPDAPILERTTDNETRVRVHRFVIWPRTASPVLLLTNPREDRPAAFGTIRLLSGWQRLPRAFADAPNRSNRFVAAYMNRPLLPESFSAMQDPGAPGSLGADDWTTFFESGRRLIDSLQHVGYDGLMLSVWNDGSAIYPSQHLEPSPLYDTGLFLGEAQDPMRKDVLELLFRQFDREGLRLIPTLDFCAPLPELEALLQDGGPSYYRMDASHGGIRCIGRHGSPWHSNSRTASISFTSGGPTISTTFAGSEIGGRGRSVYYNILDPRVQEAMLNVVREVATLYGRHPSFEGIGIQLSPDGYAMLPGPDWGLDNVTIARFEEEVGIQVQASGPNIFASRADFLEANCPQLWLDWRTREIHRFYAKVQQEVNLIRNDARVYLAGASMLSAPKTEYHFRPQLPSTMTIRESMRRLGIDPLHFDGDPRLVLLRPTELMSPRSLQADGMSLEKERLLDFDTAFKREQSMPGCLFFHAARRNALPEFDQIRAQQDGSPPTWVWTSDETRPTGAADQRRFAQGLASLDTCVLFDGGELFRTSMNEETRSWIEIYRQLPVAPFQKYDSPQESTQPAVVRYYRDVDGLYAYVVNQANFPIETHVRLNASPSAVLERLGGSDGIARLSSGPQGIFWRVSLPPYGLAVAKITDPHAAIFSVRTMIPADLPPVIERRIHDLSNRVAAVRMLGMPLNDLPNANFEAPIQERHSADDPSTASSTAPHSDSIPGWRVQSAPDETFAVRLIESDANDSGLAACLMSRGQGGTLIGTPWTAPPTERVALLVWIGTPAQDTGMPPFTLAVQNTDQGNVHDVVSFEQLPQPTETITRNGVVWRHFHVPFTRRPLDASHRYQLRFDMTGPGTVCIDQIELYGISFSRTEHAQLVDLVSATDYDFRHKRYADCLNRLEGYWPQFLMTYAPIAPPESSSATASLPPLTTPSGSESRLNPPGNPSTDSTSEPNRSREDVGFLDQVRDFWSDIVH